MELEDLCRRGVTHQDHDTDHSVSSTLFHGDRTRALAIRVQWVRHPFGCLHLASEHLSALALLLFPASFYCVPWRPHGPAQLFWTTGEVNQQINLLINKITLKRKLKEHEPWYMVVSVTDFAFHPLWRLNVAMWATF